MRNIFSIGWLNHQLVSGYEDIFCHRLEGTKPAGGFILDWFPLPETKHLHIGRAPKGKYSSNHPFSCSFAVSFREYQMKSSMTCQGITLPPIIRVQWTIAMFER